MDDGKVVGCRALLTQRSSFMAAMLGGCFHESHQYQVTLPDIDTNTLRLCLHYIYLDECPLTKDVYEAMDVLAAADRFCLSRLMDQMQNHIINTYLVLSGDDPDAGSECLVALKTLELLEPAEVSSSK